MSALDWGIWLRSGEVVGPPVKRGPRFVRNVPDGRGGRVIIDADEYQAKLAAAVQLDRFVMVHICDTTKSALDG